MGDGIKWEAKCDLSGGFMPSVGFDFNSLCGSPPVHLAIYELPGAGGKDAKHYKSLKKYYFRVAVWSALKPPEDGVLEAMHNESMVDAVCTTPAAPTAELDLLGLTLEDG